jgi:hypothetical protein
VDRALLRIGYSAISGEEDSSAEIETRRSVGGRSDAIIEVANWESETGSGILGRR